MKIHRSAFGIASHGISAVMAACIAVVVAGITHWQAPFALSADGTERAPVPSMEARKAAAAKVRDVFGGDVSKATSADAKARLAKELVGHAAGTADPIDRYVLLDGARSLAMEAGNVDLVLEVLNAIAAAYFVDADEAEVQALESLAGKAPIDAVGKIAERLMAAGQKAAASGAIDSAEDIAQSAVKAARRGKDRDLQRTSLEALAAIREQKTVVAREKSLEDKVRQAPDDIDALTALGIYRCFVKGDWDSGIPLLAKGNDPLLRDLARMEAAGAAAGAQHAALGDRWWEFSARAPKDQQAGAETRAQMHYGLALSELTGLEQARITKRIEEIEHKLASSGKKSGTQRQKKGIVLQLDARVAATLSGIEGPARNSAMRVTAWRDSAGPFKAVATDGATGPMWDPVGCGGKPGLVFTGNERLQLTCPVPAHGGMVIVCFPKAVVHQRPLTGPVGLALRADGSIWGEAKTEKTTERVMTQGQGLYKPQSPLALAVSWPAPFSLAIGSRAADAGPPLASPLSTATRWTVGGSSSGAEPFNGCIQQIIVFDRPLTRAELSAAAPGLF